MKKSIRHIALFAVATLLSMAAMAQSEGLQPLPGTIVSYSPASKGKYLGSPSICILPNGRYVVSHDYFGPKSHEFETATTNIFVSDDRGASWYKTAELRGQFWSSLFYHNGALYIFGTCRHHGNIVLRKSSDNGESWTNPYDADNGLIVEGEYHTAPTPVIVHKGRIYKAFEYATDKSRKWGRRYSAVVLSAPANANLLDAENWRRSNILTSDMRWMGGNFRGWLEGNMVYDRGEDKLVNILRVHNPRNKVEHCAVVNVEAKGKRIEFDSESGFRPFPGGAKKFTIRYDERTKRYWTLANGTTPSQLIVANNKTRNRLALYSSEDLISWREECIVAEHPDVKYHGVQYVDWVFDGEDIVAVIRTAWDDEEGQANNYHNSNYILLNRIEKYAEKGNNSSLK